MNKGFTPESLKALVNDVVFWSKHTNGKRIPKSKVIKAVLNGESPKLVHYITQVKTGVMEPLRIGG